MNLEITSAKYTDRSKVQFLAYIRVDGSDPFPFYVSLENEDSSEAYKIIKAQFDSGELVPDAPEIDLDAISAEVRAKRNRMLTDTDYLVNPDYPISDTDSEAVKAYRQALRDITKQNGFPLDVVWPDKPSFIK